MGTCRKWNHLQKSRARLAAGLWQFEILKKNIFSHLWKLMIFGESLQWWRTTANASKVSRPMSHCAQGWNIPVRGNPSLRWLIVCREIYRVLISTSAHFSFGSFLIRQKYTQETNKCPKTKNVIRIKNSIRQNASELESSLSGLFRPSHLWKMLDSFNYFFIFPYFPYSPF